MSSNSIRLFALGHLRWSGRAFLSHESPSEEAARGLTCTLKLVPGFWLQFLAAYSRPESPLVFPPGVNFSLVTTQGRDRLGEASRELLESLRGAPWISAGEQAITPFQIAGDSSWKIEGELPPPQALTSLPPSQQPTHLFLFLSDLVRDRSRQVLQDLLVELRSRPKVFLLLDLLNDPGWDRYQCQSWIRSLLTPEDSLLLSSRMPTGLFPEFWGLSAWMEELETWGPRVVACPHPPAAKEDRFQLPFGESPELQEVAAKEWMQILEAAWKSVREELS